MYVLHFLMYFLNKLINTKTKNKHHGLTQPNVKYLGGLNVKVEESTIETCISNTYNMNFVAVVGVGVPSLWLCIHLLYVLGPSSRQNERVSVASSSKNSVQNASHHRISQSYGIIH